MPTANPSDQIDEDESSSPSVAVHLDGITKQFPGGIVATEESDLTVKRGTVHALLGENGAGKTTLMNVLYGLFEPTSGTIYLDGERVEFASPQDAIERGVGMIHQHFTLVEPMTVLENVALGWEPVKYGGLAIDETAIENELRALSERYGFDIADCVHTPVEELGVGTQQRVEIVKTLYRGADVFIFDEPTAVLTPQETEELFGVFDQLTGQGKTIIFITHKLEEALTAADAVTVLRDGRTVTTVDAADVTTEDLARKMVGRDVLFGVERRARTQDDAGLVVDSLTVHNEQGRRVVNTVDLRVRHGEIFGIAGVDGNGQTELVETIAGLRDADAGSVQFDGRDVTDCSRRERLHRGLAYIPSERQERALIMSFDLVQNAVLGSQHRERFRNGRQLDWDAVHTHAQEIIDTYDVRPANPNALARSLSGGNQQKFVIGREFLRDPDIVVAAHPTRGVDVGSMEFVHHQLVEMAEKGVAVLLVSASLDEVTALSDRVGVMYDGEFVDVVDPEAVTDTELGLLMAGERPDTAGGSVTKP